MSPPSCLTVPPVSHMPRLQPHLWLLRALLLILLRLKPRQESPLELASAATLVPPRVVDEATTKKTKDSAAAVMEVERAKEVWDTFAATVVPLWPDETHKLSTRLNATHCDRVVDGFSEERRQQAGKPFRGVPVKKGQPKADCLVTHTHVLLGGLAQLQLGREITIPEHQQSMVEGLSLDARCCGFTKLALSNRVSHNP